MIKNQLKIFVQGYSSPLHRAIEWNNMAIIEFLVDHKLHLSKPSFEYGDELDRTALHWAAMHERLPIIELLIKKGAKLNQEDKEGMHNCLFNTNRQYAPAHCRQVQQTQCSQSAY